MRIQITDRLSFGNEDSCSHAQVNDVAVVHACKHPCHRGAVGYFNTLPSSHPNYLHLIKGHHLYLNMIDPPGPMFMMDTFVTFLSFVDREIAERPVHIHCNQGQSRAPSLTLLYMSKRLGLLPDTSYADAANAFRVKYPYTPGAGIQSWLTTNWAGLR